MSSISAFREGLDNGRMSWDSFFKHFSSTCNTTLLRCKLKSVVARITTQLNKILLLQVEKSGLPVQFTATCCFNLQQVLVNKDILRCTNFFMNRSCFFVCFTFVDVVVPCVPVEEPWMLWCLGLLQKVSLSSFWWVFVDKDVIMLRNCSLMLVNIRTKTHVLAPPGANWKSSPVYTITFWARPGPSATFFQHGTACFTLITRHGWVFTLA